MSDDEPNIIGNCQYCGHPIDPDNEGYAENDAGDLACEECWDDYDEHDDDEEGDDE